MRRHAVLAGAAVLALMAGACESTNRVEPTVLGEAAGPAGTAGADTGTASAAAPEGAPATGSGAAAGAAEAGTPPESSESAAPSRPAGPASPQKGDAAAAGTQAGGDAAPSGNGPSAGEPGEPAARTQEQVASTEPIQIGIQVTTGLDAAYGAVGASSDAPDERAMVEALTEWVNATGGIRGRPVEVVIHETSQTSGTWASQAQAACSTFTEDHDVVAVGSSPVGGSDALFRCLARAATPLVEVNYWPFEGRDFAQHPDLLYQPGKMRGERWVRALADGLVRAGYFRDATTGQPTRVGLVRFDAPVFDRLTDGVLRPRLAEHGVEIAEEVRITTPAGVSDFGTMANELNNAILRFRRAGVTHVMFLEWAAIMPFFFMQQAESQRYRPVYGLNSNDGPVLLANEQSPNQLEGAVGVGWTPPNDVFEQDHPGGNPSWQRCIDILRAAGIRNTRGLYAQNHCDTFFFLRTTLDGAPDVTRQGLRNAVDGLGTSYRSPFGVRTRLGPDRHDGGDAYRLFAFDTGCTCFRYTSEPLPVD